MPKAALLLPDKIYLLECFDVDLEAGRLTWRPRPLHHFSSERYQRCADTQCSGREAGWPRFHPRAARWRWFVRLHGKDCARHRIIFFLAFGLQPPEIDHRDGDSLNDRVSNLRAADRFTNGTNRRNQLGKISGAPKGVTPVGKRWVAQIMTHGIHYHIGTYDSADAAHQAYCQKAKELHGAFWSPG
jgi:hypothetical protein